MIEFKKISDLQREKITNFICGMSDAELCVAVQAIPSAYMYSELRRRDEAKAKTLNEISKQLELLRGQNV